MIRIAGLALVAAVALALVVPPLQEKREEYRIRDMLLAVQESLQNYHVREEVYPMRRMSGRQLVAYLDDKGFIEEEIANPWTLESYLDTDESDEDWLRYRTNQLADTYELEVVHAGTDEVRFRLDSTENQSLE